MNWHRIHLTKDQIRMYQGDQLNTEFVALQMKNGFPKGVALFREKVQSHSGPETYYLPPSAALIPDYIELIRRYGGEPCTKPDIASVEVEVGSVDDLELLS